MSKSSNKRTLDAFFEPLAKKVKIEDGTSQNEAPLVRDQALEYTCHAKYPFPIANFPESVSASLKSLPSTIGKAIYDQPQLDLLYFQPYIPKYLERQIFQFLRAQLPFYRVEYAIKRGGTETQVRTPRYTTVFGLDETSKFDANGSVIDAKTRIEVENDRYYSRYPPRPIPKCLNELRVSTEAATGCEFNFCLVNYYASGADSISYHSDDERFLGSLPAIASFSLGAKRDFLMRHKPVGPGDNAPSPPETKPVKLPLTSGDMVLMRGPTQANWLHSIPKRAGKNAEDGGRINITFRRVMVKAGTDNYYNYNVGTGPVYKWDESRKEMRLWRL